MTEFDSNAPQSAASQGVPKPVRMLITGANGMIGHALRAAANGRGMEAVPVQRPVEPKGNEPVAPAGPGTVLWQPGAAQPFADLELLEGYDAVVHLAGANLNAKRWTAEYKKEILDSRTRPTGALALTLARLRKPPKVLISASATGFYGSRGDEVLTEESAAGQGFLADVCKAWEGATAPAVSAGIRVVHMRFGVVLTPFGGALKQMLPPFKLGAGGRLGSGKQWTSWVALEDLLDAILFVIEQEGLSGAVNVVSPAPVRNVDFTRALGRAVHRPALIPIPAFALRAAFGEIADEALLASCRAMPDKLQAAGFKFRWPEVGPTLEAMLAEPGAG